MVRSRVLSLVVALTTVLSLPAQGVVNPTLLRADPGETSSPARRAGAAGVVAAVRGAVVWVAIEVQGARSFTIQRASSGVVIDRSGLILTWGKLVAEMEGATDKRLFVQLDDAENTQLGATIVRIDAASGLALLRVVPPAAGLQAAVAGPDAPPAGEPLVVVARPEGKEMLAFGGCAGAAVAGVTLGGVAYAANEIFLTDARNDERCDGAPVFDSAGRLVGLCSTEHVRRDRSEPTLEELKQPSFAVAVPLGRARKAFAAELNAAKALAAPGSSPAGGEHPQVGAVRAVAASVVSVFAGDGEWPTPGPRDPGGVVRRPDLGSGVVLTKSGLVVANAHVAKEGAPRVRSVGGGPWPAKVLATHAGTNLALLQVELPAGVSLSPAACNADDDVVLGEAVLAVGNPYGTGPVVSGGVVSAKRDREGGRIQADANLGAQNGGGAVVDVLGRLLGIADAGALDPIDVAFAMRGDRVSTETNLSTFVGMRRVRRVFEGELAAVDAQESIRTPVVPSPAERERRRSALTAMIERTSGAMLNIYVARNVAKVDEDDPFASMKEPELVPMSLGSGVIIDRSGLALSNWHVVDDATNADGSAAADHAVTARVFGGKEYKVRVLSISREDDLSLLQLELAPGAEAQAVELGSSDALAIGEMVAAIGNPHGRANTITFGLVTRQNDFIPVRGRFEKLGPVLETDAAINGGNSGGALLDMNGRLVGINSAGGGTFNNKGYAIQVDHVRKQVLTLLFAAYKLRSPDLGMRVVDEDGKVLVFDVDLRGPAAKAGLRSGDRIVSLAGVPITWSPGFAMTLRAQPPGVELELAIERQGAPQSLRLAPLPAEVWGVVKQSGLLVRDLPYAENPEAVRTSAIALHRAFTGDATGEPNVIPERVVVVEKVYAGEQPEGTDLAAGDLLLAVELRDEANNPVLRRIGDVVALRDLWNDRLLGKYAQEGGQLWRCHVARGGAVRTVDIRASRLFW